jgi:hypothetical protein
MFPQTGSGGIFSFKGVEPLRVIKQIREYNRIYALMYSIIWKNDPLDKYLIGTKWTAKFLNIS